MFKFLPHQREDLARAALRNGAILAWCCGAGKTIAAFVFPRLKKARRTLIVASADLHEQIADEGKKFFGVDVTVIRNQAHYYELVRSGRLPANPMQESEEPLDGWGEYFITDYGWLGMNGADERPISYIKHSQTVRYRRMDMIASIHGIPEASIKLAKKFLKKNTDPKTQFKKQQHQDMRFLLHDDYHCGDPLVRDAHDKIDDYPTPERWLTSHREEIFPDLLHSFSEGIGTSVNGIKCAHKASLSTLVSNTFDSVVCDEAVRLKSGIAHVAHGVFNINCKYRLAMTGTPIKNNLADVFYLACWVTGNNAIPTSLFPYANDKSAQTQFIKDHLIMQENLTRRTHSMREGKPRRFHKKTNQICNVQRLWKILSPVIIRRRKQDLGEMVKKTIIPISVPSGTFQKKCYSYHLDNAPFVEVKNTSYGAKIAALKRSKGAQLQCLRQASLDPTSTKLVNKHTPDIRQLSSSPFTPKIAAILSLVEKLTSTGEQVVIFSTFCDFSTLIQNKLNDAGLPNIVLDGRVSPKKRGKLVKAFKAGKYAVMIAGIDSMSEGHSLECASHLIMPTLSWAYDTNAQAIERVHRMSSLKEVNIYCIVTQNTMDERMAEVYQEKSDAQDIALDGSLTIQNERKPNLVEIMEDAVSDFDPTAETIDESDAERQWNATTLPRLKKSAEQWHKKINLAA